MFKPLPVAVLSLSCLCAGVAFAEPVEMRTNASVEETLDRKRVRALYLGKAKKLDNGERVKLSCMRDGSLHRDFLRQWVGMTPSQFRTHWRKRVFTGKDAMPKFFGQNSKQLDYVRDTRGAVGYTRPTQKQVKRGPWIFDPKTSRYVQRSRS